MPIYEYESEGCGCDYCGAGFEIMQTMSEEALTTCPTCGGPVRRLISITSRPSRNILSNSNLADKGFTKYVRRGDGQYTKETGPGPDLPTYK